MKIQFAILLCFFAALLVPVTGQEINPGQTFVDGQRLTAAQLTALVQQATIQPPFYTDKISQTNIASTDLLLVYSPSSGTFHKVTGAAGIYNNVAIIAAQQPYVNMANTNYFFLGYDSTNGTLFQVNLTNLLWTGAQWIQVAGLNFSNTLSEYGIFNPAWTNNPVRMLVWDTNGIPRMESMSNLVQSIAPTLGTNWSLPFTFNQIFEPWNVWFTNGVTNVWGTASPFAITNIFITNSPIPTITDTDTIPIYANEQGSNTVVTTTALYEYFTNRNALPAYTQGRCQFSGIPVLFVITNNANTTYGSISFSNTGYFASSPPFPALATPYAVDFITNGTGFYFAGANTNIPYWIVPFQTNANWARIYTNYAQAVQQTNWMTLTSQGSGVQTMVYLTNYTGFNADAIQVCAASVVDPARYQIWLRVPSPTPYYYVSGLAQGNPAANFNTSLNFDPAVPLTTNRVQVETYNSSSATYTPGLIHILISPQ